MAQDLFGTVRPRSDILRDDLTLEQFAANLQDVVAGKGPASYRDPEQFFTTSHPSSGMRNLLEEALGRVTGTKDGAPSIIRLDTSLGGGKTHSLIALFHAANAKLPSKLAAEFLNPKYLPKKPIGHIAVFVGDDVGALSFPERDGIVPDTLWGHIALQLGGAKAYQHIAKDDSAKTAPGAADLEKVIGDGPAIIMIDEIARYLTVAAGVTVGNSDLAKQTTAFMMSLIKAVEAKPNAVLVVTTTDVTNVFGEETQAMLDALKGVREVLARKEHIIRPTSDTDLASILARRLFEKMPATAAQAVATEYSDAAYHAVHAGYSLPEQMQSATWVRDVEQNYPFHPSLISVLDKRLSTIPNFNLTRGALRLLALAVRDLWKEKPANTQLIHLSHIDLRDPQIVEEVTSRVERPTLKPVIEVDILSPSGKTAHAEKIDAKRGGKCARNLATTIYFWSLTRETPGVAEANLMGSVLAPGDDYNLYQRKLSVRLRPRSFPV